MAPSTKTDTEVIIGGKVLTLSGYESEEYLQKVASYINNKFNEYNKLDAFRRQPVDNDSSSCGASGHCKPGGYVEGERKEVKLLGSNTSWK